MPERIAGIVVPDTDLVREATAFVRDVADDNLFNHSRRVFLWGSLRSEALARPRRRPRARICRRPLP
jgi:hypothetical protein